MGQDPEDIRQQIAETRAEMGDTIDALGYKADVPARAKENVQGKVDAITGTATAVKNKIVGQAQSAADSAREAVDGVPSAGDVGTGAAAKAGDVKDAATQRGRQAASVAQANPIGLALGAVAIGFLGGLLLPSTNLENEKIGPAADDIKNQVREAGADAVQHGKDVASDALEAATDAVTEATSGAKEAAQHAASTVQESGKQHAQAIASDA